MTALIPSVPEIAWLIERLLFPPPRRKTLIVNWSIWRRKHQANATKAHYKRHNMQL